jgi:hypothetical protein
MVTMRSVVQERLQPETGEGMLVIPRSWALILEVSRNKTIPATRIILSILITRVFNFLGLPKY